MNTKRSPSFGLYKLIYQNESQIANLNSELYRNLCIVTSIYYLLTIILLFLDVNILKDNLDSPHTLVIRTVLIIHSAIQCILLLYIIDGVTEPILICTTKKYLNVLTHLSYYTQFGLYWLFSCSKFYLICPVVIVVDIILSPTPTVILSDILHFLDHITFFYFIYIMSLYLKLGSILNSLDDSRKELLFSIPNKYKYVNQYLLFLEETFLFFYRVF